MKTPAFNKWFEIKGGIYDGWFLMIDDDTEGETGGYYIYYVKNPACKNGEGYDSWSENKTVLDKYFENINFKLQNVD